MPHISKTRVSPPPPPMTRGPKRPEKPSKPPGDENRFEDEIDAFHKQRDVDDDVDMVDDEEHLVLGIEDPADDDSDEDKNDEHDDDNAKYDDKEIAKMKRQAKCMEQIAGGKDDLSDDAEPEKESQAVWGNKRDIYYERGGKEHKSSDEEKSKVEEAVRLLKKRLHFLRMDDLDLPCESDRGQDEERTSQDPADDDSDEDKNDEHGDDNAKYDDKEIARMKRQAKCMEQIAGGKDDLSDVAEPEKESQAVWGNKRDIYYERGGKEHKSSDEEKSKVEEAEAVKLLQKRLHFLRMDDLDLPSESDLGQDEERTSQLRKMLDLLVHAYLCRFQHCRYPKCLKVKGLFRHGIHCKTHAAGGCTLCKNMWYLLQLHARACEASDCRVPRCKDLKEYLKMLQQ